MHQQPAQLGAPLGCTARVAHPALGKDAQLSVHPGVSAEQVQEATGFELSRPDGDVPVTREPSDSELVIIRELLDPKKLRDREVAPPQVTQ